MTETALPPDAQLRELESLAAELAGLAGTEIRMSLGRTLAVRYKGEDAGPAAFKDPVSEVDRHVEQLLRDRLAESFPGHGIVGEEMATRAGDDPDFVWVVDPIDGTANFVNGFPLFAASIGVLFRGQPVVGAIWCSTSHAIRAGVYHARAGGRLRFEDEPLQIKGRTGLRRHLAGVPHLGVERDLPFDARKTGSAALECAFVAAGLLKVARFDSPNVWDVGAGIALVRATGGEVLVGKEGSWQPFERFAAADEADGVGVWRHPLIVGEPDAVPAMAATPPP